MKIQQIVKPSEENVSFVISGYTSTGPHVDLNYNRSWTLTLESLSAGEAGTSQPEVADRPVCCWKII